MNAVDATDRTATQQDVEPPSLLTIILDTNPYAWALLADSLPLSKAVANLLVFINAHLAMNYANRVAVVASHSERAEWLYPTPAETRQQVNGDASNGETDDGDKAGVGGAVQPSDDANKYRPFAQLEYAFMTNLQKLMRSTTTDAISSSPSTMLAGALTRALAYITKQTAALPTASNNPHFNYSDPSSAVGGNSLSAADDPSTTLSHGSTTLTTRILILSVSGDLADKYIELMNTIFACQRLGIPLDVLKLAGDPTFLQQAADTTGGIYISLSTPQARAGLLQYLMFAYLPDATARNHLVMPGEGEGVDFRAACFCHKRVVDIGFVCSICLSIFCEPVADGVCLLCGSHLSLGNYGRKPVVVARGKKKGKKKRVTDGMDTPGSGGGTPGPG